MHVSGHELMQWVQRYACAKLSETVWLAGGALFMGMAYMYIYNPNGTMYICIYIHTQYNG